LVPIAAFLAGALLTLLLPVSLLIALVVWYWIFSVRAPSTADEPTRGTAPARANPVHNPDASTPAADPPAS